MKFLVVQTGARRGYAVPAILEQAGMLERFYTDFCADVGLGRWLRAGRSLPFIGQRLSRLNNRRLPCAIRAKTRTFFNSSSFNWLSSGGGDPAQEFCRSLRRHRRWTNAMVRAGFGSATHLFSMLSEAGSLIKAAKDRGLTVVCEVYILLSTERLLQDEQRAFPGWGPALPDYASLRLAEGGDFGMLEQSDLLLCPSAAVRDDLISNWGVPAGRTAVVPYGIDPRWLELEQAPQPGRVLFVGTADLRKGIHYLAQAAEKLIERGVHCDFRVAGHVSPMVAQQRACRHLTFLGRVPRDRIHEEFRQADVFVLPSLAEGSAEVIYEALACGLPVITTAAAGSVVRDGIEGRIVPERDVDALTEAIAQSVENRVARNRMAASARQRAREFTWDRYAERLISALKKHG